MVSATAAFLFPVARATSCTIGQGGDSHLPGTKDEDAGGEEGHDGGRQDEQLPLVEVGGLLQLLHDGVVESEANKEADPHGEEEARPDHIHDQVYSKVAHFDFDFDYAGLKASIRCCLRVL